MMIIGSGIFPLFEKAATALRTAFSISNYLVKNLSN
jgi:hypothetical protein